MKGLSSTAAQTWAGAAALVLLVGAGIYGYHTLSARYTALAESKSALEQKTLELSDALYQAQQGLAEVQGRLGGFESQVGSISGTVDVLEKLKDTDREILQKYSKVFFLSENYAPARLSQIEPDYTYNPGRPEKLSTQVLPFMEKMFNAAHDDGVALYVESAYRSFAEQKALKSAYTITYGAGTANAFSADQGYSEHQLGTTMDIVGSRTAGLTEAFDKTPGYQWLTDNAYKYGFVISYPKSNTFYIYEPWHWRFVGIELATDLHKSGKHFYDLEQREIDDYLPTLFDQ